MAKSESRRTFRGLAVGSLVRSSSTHAIPGAVVATAEGKLITTWHGRTFVWEWIGEGGADLAGVGHVKNVWALRSIK